MIPKTKRHLSIAAASIAALMLQPIASSAPKVETKPDNSWISVSGSVTKAYVDSFRLDYGEGVIEVEMDDGDYDMDGLKIYEGDQVTVTGKIDDDMFEKRTIEASSVYVEDLNTYFYASARDEEDYPYIAMTNAADPYQTIVQGTVSSKSDEEFTIDTGSRLITVETDEMGYNPLDDEGLQRIEVGDRVSVYGDTDYDLFEGREIVADSIVTLNDGSS
ncbi:NirD/YgiW/YdeI family stress tolerance protein [Pelagicoccus sp. SDUM812003]|uniref:NirD/YgiW/YdeI family stress tolerance protein n=1 Tax=Pelagicoccus sp. SDUM812003 TaxID=3041267 RepID=UPI00280F93CB|nr:NirD/YgiW/YdeI family stress tolerance protein [Pelagicoccus sp. SDUM812003]MDQ8204894.1 NirD/YgiW/YdeI family stress tolerance protein [Pelagicoccus sp. SDUM812003]